jgi:hypothetical protein
VCVRAKQWLVGCGIVAVCVAAACSASKSDDEDDGSGASGAGGSGAGNPGSGGFTGPGGSGSGGMENCAAETFPGVEVPLDIHIMLDKSASMQDSNKWTNVITALNTFVSDAHSDGIGVGVAFFPTDASVPPPSGCDPAMDMCGEYGPCVPILNICSGGFGGDSCVPADYAVPVLAIEELPGAAGALQSTFGSTSPDGDTTPTGKALAGARIYATDWAAAHPTHLTYILFATDGEPTGCGGDAQAEAAAAAAATPPVKTFVIGVGSQLTFLNAVAAAGGTGQAYLVDSSAGTTQEFLDALAEIRNTGACKFQIPPPTMGTPDYGLVNVTIADPNDPDNTITVPKVSGPGACTSAGGWYYDDETNPTYIELCPATCEEVQSGGLQVEVEIGCETIIR